MDRDFIITAGGVTSTAGTLQIGGSWTNSDTFTHNSGTVLFDSTDPGETVDTGSHPFNIVTFNNSGGGWTITNDASSTGNWNITLANDFTVDTNITIEVQGQYIISNTAPTATVWNSNSVLYLNSGTNYTVGSTDQAAETYQTLQIGQNTDIRTWSSTIGGATVDPSGSLYSQRNGSIGNDLYIWGDYHTVVGATDYWSYANDFDGTPGADRPVNVRFDANATATLDVGGTLNVIGTATASTTINRQGAGNYAIKVEGGTLNMQYYQVSNADQYGLNLTGSPTITSLDYGNYELSVEGGSMMTVVSTVIDANITKIITGCSFSTTSDLNTAYNVTETGTPSSYWTFEEHYGNLDGEAYDSDPGDIPGYIRWDDSGITVSGTIYLDEGQSIYDCSGNTLTVRIKLNGIGDYTDDCTGVGGTYSMTVPVTAANDVLTVFLDGETEKAVTITKASSTDDAISGLDLYQDRVIIRHEDSPAAAVTIADMA